VVYTHRVVRIVVLKELLPHVNLVVSLLNHWLLGTHQGGVQVSHLDYYLDEFTFQFNRRTSHSHGMLFGVSWQMLYWRHLCLQRSYVPLQNRAKHYR